jgi:UDP-N-acetyl-D-mannosaminuronic acid dehydrogenase
MFAISNQIAYVADELGLDAHEAIATANYEYDRNDIPTPGTVGGKCLPKDPHFLMDEFIADQPTTPDLFNFARRTNESLQSYVTTELLIKQPEKVALLGLSYKRGVGDTFNSPAKAIHDALVTQGRGIAVDAYDPHVEGFDGDVAAVLDGADVVVLAVNHAEFDDIEETINGAVARDATVYDVWGHLDRTALDVAYDGLGIN